MALWLIQKQIPIHTTRVVTEKVAMECKSFLI
jgi:hypothetical protein